MTVTLAQMLTTVTQPQVFNILLSIAQANGFPTQSWQSGGVELTRLQEFSTAIVDFVTNYVPAYVGGGFTDSAVGGWLDLLMQGQFNLTRNNAVSTQGNITLTAASGVSSQTLAAGKLIAVFGATGNRYLNTASVTIPAGPGSVVAQFQAENPGASYADASSSGNITLATPIPGVTLTNPASTFSGITHTGSGTGTVTPSGSPTAPHALVVSVTTTGNLGVAAFSYQLDGAAAVSVGSVSSFVVAGITVTMANGGSGTSFVLGDTYSFSTPGTWITQQGANAETDTAGAARCKARWSSLSSVPTGNLYYLLATSTPNVGSQVNQCIVVTDQFINNKVNIIVAGPGGVLPNTTISAIQAYITPRARGCDNPVVQSPTTTPITIAATITVAVAQLAAAQSAIALALTNYVNAAGINGTLRLAAIIDTIMNISGVIDCSGVTINGTASNLTLGGVGSYVIAGSLTQSLTYQTQ